MSIEGQPQEIDRSREGGDGEGEQLESIGSILDRIQVESTGADIGAVDFVYPETPESLKEFEEAWSKLAPETQRSIDTLIAPELRIGQQEGTLILTVPGADGKTERIGEVTGDRVEFYPDAEMSTGESAEASPEVRHLVDLKEGMTQETDAIAAETPIEQRPQRIMEANTYAKIAMIGAALGAVAHTGEASARDLITSQDVQRVIVNPEMQAQRQEMQAQHQFENRVRAIQVQYNRIAERINLRLSQLQDKEYLELRKQKIDLSIEMRYASRLANATPEQREQLLVQAKLERQNAYASQELRDKAEISNLEIKLKETDMRCEEAVKRAQADYANRLGNIDSRKAQSRANAIFQVIQRATR